MSTLLGLSPRVGSPRCRLIVGLMLPRWLYGNPHSGRKVKPCGKTCMLDRDEVSRPLIYHTSSLYLPMHTT